MRISKRGAEYRQSPVNMQPAQRKIQVSVREQTLRVLEDGQEVANYPISTSKFGLGSEEGSYKTPLGQFRISEKHGDDAPPYTVFKSRRAIGQWSPEQPAEVEEDLVLSRILWLEGAEEANANTKERYIYIHGTNHEGDIGRPASMGCVRMRNPDVIELYALVDAGVEVEITA